ncbi:ABC transporter G family member 23 isoform X1 [Folsomia candida]|uniref:ABC transporter G family member 23 isoform X1 n=3 Tax=Folsomia candida TaxID=158441 RepID=UPI001604AF84|nr:ABC transporter G family member 23 isoform X1 [Folsomia candida]
MCKRSEKIVANVISDWEFESEKRKTSRNHNRNNVSNKIMSVSIKNGFKRFGNGNLVLRNINVSVCSGEIYGLLGASGCGKTTLLSCIVGLRKLESGQVNVGNQPRPGNLGSFCGYMPQETSLLSVLTIREVLKYFGLLYGMDMQEIEHRTHFLSDMLDLNQLDVVVNKLSGGQKRRVSLAAAMIHNPALLVLDEPCVGLDPLLRQRIWEFLTEISRKQGKTVIISTHYIEETKFCDKIGFLRGGRLLVEDSPTSLLARFQSTKLPDVFTQLCRNDENMSHHYEKKFELVNNQRFSENLAPMEHLPDKMSSLNIRRNNASIFHALFSKWWHRTRRDWRLYIGQLGIPILCVFFMQNIIGREPNRIPVSLVYNNAELCENLKHLNSSNECFSNIGVCNLLDKFDDEFIWIPTNSYEDGVEQIKVGRTRLLIEFPANYETHFQHRIIYRHFASNESLQGSTISVRIMESGLILSMWARKLILERYIIYLQNIMLACSISDDVIKPPLQFRSIYGSSETLDLLPYMQLGLLILLMFIMPKCLGILWMEDKVAGLEDRDYVTGVSLWHRLIVNTVTQSFMIFMQIAIFFGLFCGVYGMEIKGPLLHAVGLVYTIALCSVTIGFLTSTVCEGTLEAIFITIVVSTSQLFSSGILYSTELAPPLVRTVFHWMPLTDAIEALRSICTRGWDISHPVVWIGFLPAIGGILISVAFSFLAGRMRYK